MSEYEQSLEALDVAIASGRGLLAPSRLQLAAAGLAELRNRFDYLGRTLTVALVGPTGSGKSSLLNAIAGDSIAEVSRIRPTTGEPLAWIPADVDPAMLGWLDAAGINGRVTQTRLAGVALLDMPDIDSIRERHRERVEELIPKVDALVWVLDPTKYRDSLIHDEFLRRLTRYAPQTIVVVNKADTISGTALAAVVEDVARSMLEDGYREPRVVAVAANPSNADTPQGIDALLNLLGVGLETKRTARGKLIADTETVVRSFGMDAGVWEGSSTNFDVRWESAKSASLAALEPSSRLPAERALFGLRDFIATIAGEVGGSQGDAIRRDFPPQLVMSTAAEALRSMTATGNAEVRPDEVMDAAIGNPMRSLLTKRALLAASVAQSHVLLRRIAQREGSMTW